MEYLDKNRHIEPSLPSLEKIPFSCMSCRNNLSQSNIEIQKDLKRKFFLLCHMTLLAKVFLISSSNSRGLKPSSVSFAVTLPTYAPSAWNRQPSWMWPLTKPTIPRTPHPQKITLVIKILKLMIFRLCSVNAVNTVAISNTFSSGSPTTQIVH